MSNSKKVLLVGWDAADWKVIHPLVDQGLMPNVARLIENGAMGNLRTLLPALSPMLWTSIATGKRPFKHGIYGFTEPTSDGKGVQPITIASRSCKAIWNILNQHDMHSIVVGWWPSHPAEPINGVMVSDFFHKAPKKPGESWNLRPKSIHPPEKFEELRELRVHPQEIDQEHLLFFVPQAAEVDQDSDPRLSMVMKMIAECTSIHSAATHLLENEPWDFAAIYYDAIDHFSHGFMKYHPPQQRQISDQDFRLYSNVVTAGYVYHDMMLGRLLDFAGEDTTLILMSDHGFHPDHLRPHHIPAEPAGPATEHRDYGILLVSGPGIRQDHIVHGANLLDIAPTILSIYGLAVGEDMDGQPLTEIFETEPDIETIPSWEEVEGPDGQHDKNMIVDSADSKAALEQLIALGYIDRPDDNSEKAVAHAVRELDYNLARAYMDADMHGDAMPLLLELYKAYSLEFRFGIQLANCLRTLNRKDDLKRLIDDLNNRWRVASEEAKTRLRDIAKIAKTRREQWLEMKKVDDANKDDPSNPPVLARVNYQGKPLLFSEVEGHNIRKLRAVARGNPQTLDFLAATIATAESDFKLAVELLERAEDTQSTNPGFQYHLGMAYLGLKRYEDGERAFTRSLAQDEFYPNGLMGLCRTYVEMGEYEKAVEYGKQAVGLKYHFPVAHYFLGQAQEGYGDDLGAIESFNTAIGQNPNFQQAHERLAHIYATSQPDRTLSTQHERTARSLADENMNELAIHEPINLPELGAEDFRDQLPEVGREEENTDEFLRCLAQPKAAPSDTNERSRATEEILIVSGLPRSGTSMMMQMLAAAGVEPFTDQERQPDESNPKGYYEADLVKQLVRRNNWLDQCQGKALKVVAPLIPYLPQEHRYKVVFMNRDMDEILGSQRKMLDRLDATGTDLDDDRLAAVFLQQANYAINLLALHGYPVLRVEYRDAIDNPAEVAGQLADFLDRDVDIQAVAAAVDPSLYRQKTPANSE